MPDDQNTDPKQKLNPLPIAAWFSLAVILYVLSIGPVVYFHDREMLSATVTEFLEDTFYAPLFWLYGESEFFSQFLEHYTDLWD